MVRFTTSACSACCQLPACLAQFGICPRCLHSNLYFAGRRHAEAGAQLHAAAPGDQYSTLPMSCLWLQTASLMSPDNHWLSHTSLTVYGSRYMQPTTVLA